VSSLKINEPKEEISMKYVSPKLRMTAIAVLLAFTSMMMAPTGALAAPKKKPASSYIQGTDSLGNVLNGVLTVTGFSAQANQLVAQGVVNGTITSASGLVTPVVNQQVTLPVVSVAAMCSILNLVLGPVDLNLLGLVVHLNHVVLNITAV
jgi:hypothetical protein